MSPKIAIVAGGGGGVGGSVKVNQPWKDLMNVQTPFSLFDSNPFVPELEKKSEVIFDVEGTSKAKGKAQKKPQKPSEAALKEQERQKILWEQKQGQAKSAEQKPKAGSSAAGANSQKPKAEKKEKEKERDSEVNSNSNHNGSEEASGDNDEEGWQQSEGKKKKKDEAAKEKEEAKKKEARDQQRKILHRNLISQHLNGTTLNTNKTAPPNPYSANGAPRPKPIASAAAAAVVNAGQKRDSPAPKQALPPKSQAPEAGKKVATAKPTPAPVEKTEAKHGSPSALSVVVDTPKPTEIHEKPAQKTEPKTNLPEIQPVGEGSTVPSPAVVAAAVKTPSLVQSLHEDSSDGERDHEREREKEKHRWRREVGSTLPGFGSFSTYQQRWQKDVTGAAPGLRREQHDMTDLFLRLLHEGAEERKVMVSEARAEREFFLREMQAEREAARKEREMMQQELHQLRMLLLAHKISSPPTDTK